MWKIDPLDLRLEQKDHTNTKIRETLSECKAVCSRPSPNKTVYVSSTIHSSKEKQTKVEVSLSSARDGGSNK